MKVIKFSEKYIDDVFQIQQKAYKPLFDKYKDTDTNPYMEGKEEILAKYTRNGTCGYVFIENEIPVGAVRIIVRGDVCKVSALAVLPEYQNRGIAQTALKEIEKIHSGCNCWILDTILQEKGNCHLYEKLGYIRIGAPKKINDNLTLVDYKKIKNLEIRKITENDYTNVCALYNNELNIKITQPKFNARVKYILENNNHNIFVAAYSGKVVGFITFEKAMAIECDYVKINGIAVNENYQGQGIGSQLISRAETYAKEHNIDLIILNSSIQKEQTHRFYEKLGYVKSSYCFRRNLEE